MNGTLGSLLSVSEENYKASEEQSIALKENMVAMDTITSSIQVINETASHINAFSKTVAEIARSLIDDIKFFSLHGWGKDTNT